MNLNNNNDDFFQSILVQYVEPEINKRKSCGAINEDFEVRDCLITFYNQSVHNIAFNYEIIWRVELELNEPKEYVSGELVYIHSIKKIKRVYPPQIDNNRVSYICLLWNGIEYVVLFDFDPDSETDDIWEHEETVREHLNYYIVKKTLEFSRQWNEGFEKFGLWTAPALLPYPINKIATHINNNDYEGAKDTLLDFCNYERIERLTNKWLELKVFEDRKISIEQALYAHKNRMYFLSISALLPQIEGIITDFAYEKVGDVPVPYKQDKKTKWFRDYILNENIKKYMSHYIIESTINFILEGPVLKSFDWKENVNPSFPNRNVIGHGKFSPNLYTEENSVKIFLLIDTIFEFMK